MSNQLVLLLSAALGVIVYSLYSLFTPPRKLSHIKKVPLGPLLLSYGRGESEDRRIKDLILPFAKEHNEAMVLVFAFGRWLVHVVDPKAASTVSVDIRTWPKETPPDEMLFWRFFGYSNIIVANGEPWKKYSRMIKSALNRNIPVEEITMLAKSLFKVMGNGGRIHWEDLTTRFALDAVGLTVMGYNYDSLSVPDSPFIKDYHDVIEGMADPIRVLFPKLETWFPRKEIIKKIDRIHGIFLSTLEAKRTDKGHDMLTYMLEEPAMTDIEFRDNLAALFVAGHDTTSAAMSSFVYYMAIHPEYQKLAREEAKRVLGKEDPDIQKLQSMPFILACIKESMRMNNPVNYPLTRSPPVDAEVSDSNGKQYYIPAGTTMIIGINALHSDDTIWSEPTKFDPYRFMDETGKSNVQIESSSFMPFSVGPRQCPAKLFALYELRILISMLLREWEWTLPADSSHRKRIINGFSSFGTNLPKDLYINFRRQS